MSSVGTPSWDNFPLYQPLPFQSNVCALLLAPSDAPLPTICAYLFSVSCTLYFPSTCCSFPAAIVLSPSAWELAPLAFVPLPSAWELVPEAVVLLPSATLPLSLIFFTEIVAEGVSPDTSV